MSLKDSIDKILSSPVNINGKLYSWKDKDQILPGEYELLLNSKIEELRVERDRVRDDRKKSELDKYKCNYEGKFLKYTSTGPYSSGRVTWSWFKSVTFIGNNFIEGEGLQYEIELHDTRELLVDHDFFSIRVFNGKIRVHNPSECKIVTREEFLEPIEIYIKEQGDCIRDFQQTLSKA